MPIQRRITGASNAFHQRLSKFQRTVSAVPAITRVYGFSPVLAWSALLDDKDGLGLPAPLLMLRP
ncbi:MAG: hypothetical protein ABJH45_23020 [Paracoccaceae bacterium]